MYTQNIEFHINNRSDALDAFNQIIKSIEANGDISGYIESISGAGRVFDCLCALKDVLEKGII